RKIVLTVCRFIFKSSVVDQFICSADQQKHAQGLFVQARIPVDSCRETSSGSPVQLAEMTSTWSPVIKWQSERQFSDRRTRDARRRFIAEPRLPVVRDLKFG